MGEVVTLRLPPTAPDHRTAMIDALAVLDIEADEAGVELLMAWLRFYGYRLVPVDD